jgi:hypothetical protein
LNYWILQCDPAGFRISDWLRDFPWVSDDKLVDCWPLAEATEAQPGDTVFIWVMARRGIRAGIRGQGKIVITPEVFSMANRKSAYCRGTHEKEKPASQCNIALKYDRLCLGAPVSAKKLEAALGALPLIFKLQREIYGISEAAGKTIERLMREGTGFGDSIFCRA